MKNVPELPADHDFKRLVESLYARWCRQEVYLTPYYENLLDVNAIPEPYHYFGQQDKDHPNPLYFLTSNPGQVLPVQTRAYGFYKPYNSYQEVSGALAEAYPEILKFPGGYNALNRIKKMLRLAELLGYSGICETTLLPFHSMSLPNKEKVFKEIESDKEIREYVSSLQGFLKEKSVICVGGGPVGGLKENTIKSTVYKKFGQQMSFDFKNYQMIPVLEKNGKVTVAAYVDQRKGCIKVFFLSIGHSNLPSEAGLKKFVQAIRPDTI